MTLIAKMAMPDLVINIYFNNYIQPDLVRQVHELDLMNS